MAGVDLSDLHRHIAALQHPSKTEMTQLIRRDAIPLVVALVLREVDAAWSQLGAADPEHGPWWPSSRDDLARNIAGKIMRAISAQIDRQVRLDVIHAMIDRVPLDVARCVATAREHYRRISPWVTLDLHEALTQHALVFLQRPQSSFDASDARACLVEAFTEELVRDNQFDAAVAKAGPASLARWLRGGVVAVCRRRISDAWQEYNTHDRIVGADEGPVGREISETRLDNPNPGIETKLVARDDTAARRRRAAAGARLLGYLREPFRGAILTELRAGADQTAAQKAAVLGTTPGAYHVRLCRAREQLRDALWALPLVHSRYQEVFLRGTLGGEGLDSLAGLLAATTNGRSVRQAAEADFPSMRGITASAKAVRLLIDALRQRATLVRRVRTYARYADGFPASVADLLHVIHPGALDALPHGFGALDLDVRRKLIAALAAFGARYLPLYWQHAVGGVSEQAALAILDQPGADGWSLLRAAADDFPVLASVTRDAVAVPRIYRVLDARVRDVLAPDFT